MIQDNLNYVENIIRIDYLSYLALNINNKAVEILQDKTKTQNIFIDGWNNLASNANPIAIEILKINLEYRNKEFWENLAKNTNSEALDILETFINKLKFKRDYPKIFINLASNNHDKAIQILNDNLFIVYYIDNDKLITDLINNTNIMAINIIKLIIQDKRYISHDNEYNILKNPNIFTTMIKV